MNKKLRLYLLLSLIGILLLAFLSSTISPEEKKIENITKKNLGERVQIKAEIAQLKEFPEKSFQILVLEDSTGKISATANSKVHLAIEKGKEYIFTGTIEEYNQTLQLKLSRITNQRV